MTLVGDRALKRLRAFSRSSEGPVVVGDRFELRHPFAEGGMGVVWAAWDLVEMREVAVKVMRENDEITALRTAREAHALLGLSHPAIVRYLACGTTPSGEPFVAMDRLYGESLADRLARSSLAIPDVVRIGATLAEALAEIHRHGIVHRDVKPSNVFLVDGSPEKACLIDFGLARNLHATAITQMGIVLGTPGYMAPEQVRAKGVTGARADVFALGCLLHEALSGRPVFGGDRAQALAKILVEKPKPIRSVVPEVPIELDALLSRMLAKAEDDRPSALAVARDLSNIFSRLHGRKHRSRIVLVAAVALLIPLAVGPFLWRTPKSKGPSVSSPATSTVGVVVASVAPRAEASAAPETVVVASSASATAVRAAKPTLKRPTLEAKAQPSVIAKEAAGSIDITRSALEGR